MGKHIGECVELVIKFEAGSDFQYDHARSLLQGIGTAVSAHLRDTHKNNWCYYYTEALEPKTVSEEIKKLEEEGRRYEELYLQEE